MRTCPKCGAVEQVGRANRPRKFSDLHSHCTPCYRSEFAKRGYAEGGRDKSLRRRFGLGEAEYETLLAAQGGGCAICGEHTDSRGYRLSVEHDHSTNVIRGITCNDCNHMLCKAKDRPDLLRRAADYLELPPLSEVLREGGVYLSEIHGR